jgi:SAM-dependent methyltransferase
MPTPPGSEAPDPPRVRVFSKPLQRGYINVYSSLTPQEQRQLSFVRRYKVLHPDWDSTTIVQCKLFESVVGSLPSTRSDGKISVLDAGCGHGNYIIDEYRERIYRATGLDVDPTCTAGNRSLDEIHYGSLERVPFADNAFDLVTCLWVFEHLTNPARVLGELCRVLKPRGALLFTTPNRRCLLVRAKRLVPHRLSKSINQRAYGREPDDVFQTRYAANDRTVLRHLLEGSGFRDVRLVLNYDPGYTSFNGATFAISNWLETVFQKFNPELNRQHIIGIARK